LLEKFLIKDLEAKASSAEDVPALFKIDAK